MLVEEDEICLKVEDIVLEIVLEPTTIKGLLISVISNFAKPPESTIFSIPSLSISKSRLSITPSPSKSGGQLLILTGGESKISVGLPGQK